MIDVDSNARAVFYEALDRASPEQLSAYLDEACGQDTELRTRVENLLRAHQDAGNFLGGASSADGTIEQPPIDERPGTVIGPYKLLEQIGEGGFGVVFLAEQERPIRRRIALKVIKPGMDTRQVIARFDAERQALAMMDHPNIAKVHEAGATENGRPYFVMELVQGVPITDYCDRCNLTTRERLELFITVCQAVQHAHQKGIIHRDIKPSNVMVTLYDGQPVPKVIDFGVAKATEQKLTERTLFTRYGTMVGTFEYMSPEQAEMSALGVDTRSDIFSLGVLLYELLTGSTPLTHKRVKEAGFAEVLRLIKEEEPPRPSTRLSDSGEALASISANRHTEPAKLTKLLRGELDWIAMKSLEKDRNRRYESASAFGADVQHYLADEPVRACPPSAIYGFKKFVRGNKGPMLAASLVLLALVVGIAGTTFGLIRAERRRVEAQQAEADTLAAYRASTDDAIKQLIGSKPDLGPQERTYLENTLKRWQAFAARQGDDERSRAIRGEGHYRVGFLLQKLGRPDEARAEYELARDLQKRLAEQFPSVPGYRRDLAGTHSQLSLVLRTLGKLDESWAEYELARDLRKRLAEQYPTVPAFQEDLAATHDTLGALLAELEKWDEARAEFERARDLQKRLAQQFPNDPGYRKHLALTHNNLGLVLKALGKWDEARSEYELARDLRKRLAEQFPAVSAYQSDLADTHNNLGILLIELRKPVEARTEFELAHDLRKRLANQFPSIQSYQINLGMSCCNFGNLIRDEGQPAESLEWFQKAIDTLRPIHEKEPREVSAKECLRNSYWGRAEALYRLARHTEAIKDWDQAIELSPPNERPNPRASRAISRLLNGQVDVAVAESAELTKSENWSAARWYDFACVYAVASGKIADKSQEYADRAMELLQRAVKAGYKDVAHMKKDTDLDPLRDREDFKKLLRELEIKQKGP